MEKGMCIYTVVCPLIAGVFLGKVFDLLISGITKGGSMEVCEALLSFD